MIFAILSRLSGLPRDFCFARISVSLFSNLNSASPSFQLSASHWCGRRLTFPANSAYHFRMSATRLVSDPGDLLLLERVVKV